VAKSRPTCQGTYLRGNLPGFDIAMPSLLNFVRTAFDLERRERSESVGIFTLQVILCALASASVRRCFGLCELARLSETTPVFETTI
jgi:hypothetical protein